MFEFHPEAKAEFDQSVEWYRARSPVTATDFDEAVYQAIGDIVAAPEAYPTYLRGTRKRLLTPKFPYLIVYRALLGGVQIIAISHGKRRQGYWRNRIRK